jgi:hypothetical protein
MALLKGKLFAGVLFAGLLLGAGEQTPVEPPVEVVQQAVQQSAPGGGHYDSGQGYVKQGHTWVKVVKASFTEVGSSKIRAGVSGGAVASASKVGAEGVAIPAMGGSAGRYQVAATSAIGAHYPWGSSSGSLVQSANAVGQTSEVKADYIGLDEIIALFMS